MCLKYCLILTLVILVKSNLAELPEDTSEAISFTVDLKDANCEPAVGTTTFGWNTNSISVAWTLSVVCVSGFRVYLNDNVTEIPAQISTTKYEYEYDGLLPCTDYVVGFSVIGPSGEVAASFEKNLTTLSGSPGKVTDVSYQFFNDSWVISWTPPALQENCITAYSLYIRDIDGAKVRTVVTNNSYEISPYVPQMIYTSTIAAYIGEAKGFELVDYVQLPGRGTASLMSLQFGWIGLLLITIAQNIVNLRFH